MIHKVNAYAALEQGGELTPFSYDMSPPVGDEVIMEVKYCGICHTDTSMINNEWGVSQYPLVAGHEVIGRVLEVGEHVKRLKTGEWVGLGFHSGYDLSCPHCLSGDHNLSPSAEGTIMGRHGGFADKVKAREAAIRQLPEGMDYQSVGPLFCAGVTVFNPLLQYDTKPTDRVAVIGIGGLGHLALQFYSAWGCDVTAFTSPGPKQEEALQLGADHTLNSRDPEEISKVASQFDLVVSTVGAPLDWNKIVTTLKPKGRLHLLGVLTKPLDLDLQTIMTRQLEISSSLVGSPSTIDKMIEFACRHDIKPQIEIFSFEQINKAIARMESGEARYRVVLEH
ncbi:MAG: NAD(P)-dependent alcohol dehydrogenase [Desulfobacterales bacterium]|jgi:uncharacterized zinc-type alcohol dehydrogenase-like protein